ALPGCAACRSENWRGLPERLSRNLGAAPIRFHEFPDVALMPHPSAVSATPIDSPKCGAVRPDGRAARSDGHRASLPPAGIRPPLTFPLEVRTRYQHLECSE